MFISNYRKLVVAFLSAFFLSTPNAYAIFGDCAQPSSNGAAPKASDALTILKVAVGQLSCEPCTCDVGGNGTITAPDALVTLKLAVGQILPKNCPVCEPALTGFVITPSAAPMLPVQAEGTESLIGTVVEPGATVELYALSEGGGLGASPIHTVVADINGKYKIRPVPTPGTDLVVCSTTAAGMMCGFVLSESVDIDPIAQFLYGTATEAATEISFFSLDEARAFRRLLDSAAIDFSAAQTVEAATNLLDAETGGLYASLIADFATSAGGPLIPVAGSYNLVQSELSVERFYEAGSGETASINSRSVRCQELSAALTIGEDAALSFTTPLYGQDAALNEISGVLSQEMAPDIVVNSIAEISAEPFSEPGPAGQAVLADAHGQLLLVSDSGVDIGQAASGGGLAVVATTQSSVDKGTHGLALALRQGSGLLESSLSGDYNVVLFEVEFLANTSFETVSRGVTVRNNDGSLTFDGSGNFTLGAATGKYVNLNRVGPDSNSGAAMPTVVFDSDNLEEPELDGLQYLVSPKGRIEILLGEEVVGQGATTPDGNIVILRFGGAEDDTFNLGFLVATKRGSGMNNASGNGTYRSFVLRMELGHEFITGSVGGDPWQDIRLVRVASELGGFVLDGSGGVTLFPDVDRGALLYEEQSLFETAPEIYQLDDATTSVSHETTTPGPVDPVVGTYSISSSGTFVAEVGDGGSVTGILSPDGSVFVYGEGEIEGDQGFRDIHIALRQP